MSARIANSTQMPLQGRLWFQGVEERFLAQPPVRKPVPGTPEIFFAKTIDNSRLVRETDPKRRREMVLFAIAVAVFFVLATVYVWQHFSAIQYGYRIEELKKQRDAISEANRSLRLEEATLKDPERIDALARRMGLQLPTAGQVQTMDVNVDLGGPVMARAAGVSVVSLPQ